LFYEEAKVGIISDFSLLFDFNGVQEGYAVSDFQFRIYFQAPTVPR